MLNITYHQGNAISVRMVTIKNNTKINIGQNVEKREPSHTIAGNLNWYSHYGKLRSFSKTKNRTIYNQFHHWVPIFKNPKTLIQKDTSTPMFTTALFTSVKIQGQPKCPSTDEWIKMWYVCIYKILLKP